jgi:hypothetical protein
MFLFIMHFQGKRATVHGRTFITSKLLQTMFVSNMPVKGKLMIKSLRTLSTQKITLIVVKRDDMPLKIGVREINFIA